MAYRGITAALPVGRQGFSGSQNPSQLQPGHMSSVDGVQLEAGVIQKEGGAAKLNPIALASGAKILAGHSIQRTDGLIHDVVFLSDGSVRHDDGTGVFGTTLRTGLINTELPPPVFVQGGGEDVGSAIQTFLFSKNNQVQVAETYALNSMVDISAPPTDWAGAGNFPIFGVHHDNRMWGGGNANDPHRIYYSDRKNHQSFSTASAGTLAVYPGEAQGLVGGLSFRGILILWKYPTGIYYVDTKGANPDQWMVRRLSRSIGGVNQSSIVQVENDILYLDHGGNLHVISATDILGDINTSNISQLADLGPFMREKVDLDNIQKACGVWYAAKRQAWFGVPEVGSDENNIRLVVDFNDPQVGPRFLLSFRDVAKSMWMRQNSDSVERPAAGDNIGFAWKLDQPERNKDGIAYPMRFETADIDFGFIDPQLKTRAKNGQFLEIVSESIGNWNLSVDVFWDDVYSQTILFNMGEGGEPLGSFELDVDALGSTAVFSNRQRMIGAGRRLRFVVENDGLNQDVLISEFHVGFSLSDERARNAAA